MGTAHSWSLSGSPRHILISSRSWNPTGAVHEAYAVLDDLGNVRNPLCCEILYCRMADSPLTGHQALSKQRAYRQSSVPLLWNCDLQSTPRSFCRLVAIWSHFDLLGVIISQSSGRRGNEGQPAQLLRSVDSRKSRLQPGPKNALRNQSGTGPNENWN